jgi:hypothetical protein
MKNNRHKRSDGTSTASNARKKSRLHSSAPNPSASDFDVEKYDGKTSEKEECDPALLGEYAIMMTLFAGGAAGLTELARSRNLLPKEFKPRDLLMLGIATHKLSRIIAKDRITGALRAPFVHYKQSVGAGEVEEEPRGRGLQRAVGELISCPYSTGPWCATALGFGMLFVPRTTRFFASILVSVAMSDFLHRAYAATKKNGT